MGNLYVSYLFHTLLSLFFFFFQFTLTAYVTSITLCQYIFTHLFHCLASNNLGSDSCLDGNIKLLTRKKFLEFLAHSPAERFCIIRMS